MTDAAASGRRSRALAHSLLLLTALIWGATFVLVKSALSEISPLLFNLIRMALASVALAAMNWRHLRLLTRSHLKAGALAGLFLAVGYQLQTLGLARTSPAKSAFLTGMVVVFVPALTLIPAFRPRDVSRPGAAAAFGSLFALAGLVLITTPAHTALRNIFSSVGVGDLLTLGCALAFAAHLLTLARVSTTMPAGSLATLQIAFATVIMVVTLPLEHVHAAISVHLVTALLVCSLFATAFAFTTQSFAQQHLPPTHTVVILALEPVFAWLTSLLFLHEGLDRRSLAGAGLILVAIAVIELVPGAHTTEIPA